MIQLNPENTSQILTWNSFDTYTENIIHQIYLMTQNSLYEIFENTTITNIANSNTIPAKSRIKASISKAQVFAWLGVSLLVLIGDVVLDALLFLVPRLDGGVIGEVIEE